MPDNTPREPDYDYPSFVARFRSAPDVFMAALVEWVDTYSARIAMRSISTERGFEYFGEDALRLARSGSRPAEGIPRTETVSLHGVRTLAHDGKGGFAFERYGPLMELRATPLSGEAINVECFLYDAQFADYFAALCDEITGMGRACGGLELVYPAPQAPSAEAPAEPASKSHAQELCEAEGYDWPPDEMPPGLVDEYGKAVKPSRYAQIRRVACAHWKDEQPKDPSGAVLTKSTLKRLRRTAVLLRYMPPVADRW